MRILFETQGQGFVFLLMVYLGLLWGAMDQVICKLWLHGHKVWGWLSCVLACVVGTIAGVWLLVQSGQEGLRVYGLLGILSGWLLYALGIGRLVDKLVTALRKVRRTPKEKQIK